MALDRQLTASVNVKKKNLIYLPSQQNAVQIGCNSPPFSGFFNTEDEGEKTERVASKATFSAPTQVQKPSKNGFPREMDEKAFLLYNFLLYCVLYSYSLRD